MKKVETKNRKGYSTVIMIFCSMVFWICIVMYDSIQTKTEEVGTQSESETTMLDNIYCARDFFFPSDDCTKQFQQLIDQVYRQGGGTIKLDAGIYNVTALDLRSNVRIQGCGIGITTIKRISSENQYDAFIRIPSYSKNFQISEVGIWGNSADDQQTTTGICIDNSDICILGGTGSITNCFIYQFSGNGLIIGKTALQITISNTYIIENLNGIYSEADGLVLSEGYIQNNQYYGLVNIGNECQISNLKSIWNGSAEDGKGHYSWGIYNVGSYCEFLNIEAQDNWCNGIYLAGENNKYINFTSDCNGYYAGIPEGGTVEEYPQGIDWTPQDSTLLDISGTNNLFIGKCSQYRTQYQDESGNIIPVAQYGMNQHNMNGCQVYVTVSDICAVTPKTEISQEVFYESLYEKAMTCMISDGSDVNPDAEEILPSARKEVEGEYRTEDYDIFPDGSDVTVKLQQLIDTVFLAGGGKIIFEAGTYSFSGIDLKSKVSFIGQGEEATVLQQISSVNKLPGFIYIPAYAIGIQISDMSLRGSGMSGNGGCGIYLEGQAVNYGGDNFHFITKPTDVPLQEEYTDKYSLFSNLAISAFSGHGFYIGEKNYAINIKNIIVMGNGDSGISALSTDGYFQHIIAAYNGNYGISIMGANNKYYDLWTYRNGEKNASAAGVYLGMERSDAYGIYAIDNFYNGILLYGEDCTALKMVADGNGINDPTVSLQMSLSRVKNAIISCSIKNTVYDERCALWALAANSKVDSSCTLYADIKDEPICGEINIKESTVNLIQEQFLDADIEISDDCISVEDVRIVLSAYEKANLS